MGSGGTDSVDGSTDSVDDSTDSVDGSTGSLDGSTGSVGADADNLELQNQVLVQHQNLILVPLNQLSHYRR